MLGLEGETQAGFLWVLEVNREPRLYLVHSGGREMGTSETEKGFGNESYYVSGEHGVTGFGGGRAD